MATTKRKILENIIEKEQDPWVIMKPSRFEPNDPELLCIFQNPAERTEAKTEIPLEWFRNNELNQIEQAVKAALRSPREQYEI